jgi:hypothetical protein
MILDFHSLWLSWLLLYSMNVNSSSLPLQLLTRLVFERGSADAAGKVAEIMGADLVHQVSWSMLSPYM